MRITLKIATTLGMLTLGCIAEQRADNCPRLYCGNSPYLGSNPFWELDETGAAYSSNALRVSGATYLGVPQTIDVEGFTWLRVPVGGGAPQPISGTVIELESKDTATTYELTVTAAPTVRYYDAGDDGTMIPTYRVSYVEIVNGERRPSSDLCGLSSGTPGSALVFQGDRYDRVSGALIAAGEDAKPWFNIACNDDARWKLALMRHVEAAQNTKRMTTADQRSALMRAIRADYCGDGKPFTRLGTEVEWINVGGWLTQDTKGDLEAVWGPHGAVCLDHPRLPDTVVDCEGRTLPSCAAVYPTWPVHGSVVTVVPPR